jgi:hypothetical protein
MPDDIEELFRATGLSLFPASARELDMDCTCPDLEVPCKHIAAVFYLLAEDFDDDPFLILGWRGREKDDLLALVASKRTGVVGSDSGPAVPELTACLDDYFGGPALEVPHLDSAGTALDQLPPVDVTVRGVRLVDQLRGAYSPPASAA